MHHYQLVSVVWVTRRDHINHRRDRVTVLLDEGVEALVVLLIDRKLAPACNILKHTQDRRERRAVGKTLVVRVSDVINIH